MKTYLISEIFIATMLMSIVAYAQKGTGEETGISRQGSNPELIELEGTIQAIESGPCQYTTGKSTSGTHMILVTSGETLNIHLGPTVEVSDLVEGSEGQQVVVKAFRTNRLPENHYIAKELSLQGKTHILRDDRLKPMWGGKYGKEKWRGRKGS